MVLEWHAFDKHIVAGEVDITRLARLLPRHDDSPENILQRLELWDVHAEEVGIFFSCISLGFMKSSRSQRKMLLAGTVHTF